MTKPKSKKRALTVGEKVAAKYKEQYFINVLGRWSKYENWERQPEELHSILLGLKTKQEVNTLLGNDSWTRRIREVTQKPKSKKLEFIELKGDSAKKHRKAASSFFEAPQKSKMRVESYTAMEVTQAWIDMSHAFLGWGLNTFSYSELLKQLRKNKAKKKGKK